MANWWMSVCLGLEGQVEIPLSRLVHHIVFRAHSLGATPVYPRLMQR
jgi:hypothetical protein